jgi:deoxyhypusine synthase
MEKAKSILLYTGTTSLSSAEVRGYDFNKGIDYTELIKSYATTGLQATNMHRAIETINLMVNHK